MQRPRPSHSPWSNGSQISCLKIARHACAECVLDATAILYIRHSISDHPNNAGPILQEHSERRPSPTSKAAVTLKPNFHYNDFPVAYLPHLTSSRGSYEEVTDLSPTFDGPREEVTEISSAPDHLDMFRWSVVSVGRTAQ